MKKEEAMRINIDETFWGDSRVFHLAIVAGEAHFMVRGRLIGLWYHCYQHRQDVLDATEIRKLMLRDDFGECLVQCHLAEKTEDGRYRICGVKERMQWLLEIDAGRQRGGKARAASASRGENGRYNSANGPASDQLDSSSIQLEPGKTRHSSSSSSSSSSSGFASASGSKKPSRGANASGKGTPVWEAYRNAYLKRWGAELPRNAQHSTACARLVERYGQADAVLMASYFLGHNDRLYVNAKHPLTLLMRDSDKIFSDMKTRRQTTATEAQANDLSAHNAQVIRDFYNKKKEQEQ